MGADREGGVTYCRNGFMSIPVELAYECRGHDNGYECQRDAREVKPPTGAIADGAG